MSTLISVHNNNGCVGRCDANCHNAKNPQCHCICGGKNHGVGLKKAVDNTAKIARNELAKNLSPEQKGTNSKIKIHSTQNDLFDEN